jgi:hypothetical protein
MKHHLSKISIGLMTLGLMGVTALTALAVTRPFHLVEHGTLTVDKDGNLVADGTGTATHLGRCLAPHGHAKPPAEEVWSGRAGCADAANRGQLEASIKGTLNPQTGKAVLISEWKGGTGRLQNASGTTVWLVQVNPDQTYDVVVDGVINY